MAALFSCAAVSAVAIFFGVKAHWKMRGMVVPVLRAKKCTKCGLWRDMLAFPSVASRACMKCVPMLKDRAERKQPGRVRLWRAQTQRVRTELQARKLAYEPRSAPALLGAVNADQLWDVLEPKLGPGMTEDNYGQWQVDHKVPVAAFDLTKPDQRRWCFGADNMQPMWASDNLAKSCAL